MTFLLLQFIYRSLFYTGYKDHYGSRIYLGNVLEYYTSPIHGVYFNVVYDADLGYCFKNIATNTIEQINETSASQFTII